jgi:hypothetical protein
MPVCHFESSGNDTFSILESRSLETLYLQLKVNLLKVDSLGTVQEVPSHKRRET